MARGLKLIQLDLNPLIEDLRIAIIYTEHGVFIDEDGVLAEAKITEFLMHLDPMNFYRGHDNNVYPKFEIKEINIY